MRPATIDDLPLLVALMKDFYAEAGYTLDQTHASQAFSALLHDSRLGSIWIIQAEQEDVGHLVITLRYAMEFGGMVACLDDLYVKPAWRNKGLSTAALLETRRICIEGGIRALTLEVAHDNGAALNVYRRAGFSESAGRLLLALALAPPSHLV